jgi:Transglycosylase SLT domain
MITRIAADKWRGTGAKPGTFARLRHPKGIGMTAADRNRIVLMLAALLVLGFGVFAVWHEPAAPKLPPSVRVVQAPRHVARTIPRIVLVPQPAPPAAPTAFDLEQRMSFGQLMKRWDPLILEAAKRFDVPVAWIRAVMQAESGGRTMLGENLPMTSDQGAMGLMQLMPETYDEMRRQYRLGADPYDPHDNIVAGAAYLHWLRGKYGYPQMFAAYNDGPGHLDQRLAQGGLLPLETQNYVSTITGRLDGTHPTGRGNLKLTRPDGTPVWIDGGAVVSVRAAFPGEYAPGIQAVVTIGRVHQAVREPLAQVRSAIRARGGSTGAARPSP